MGLFSWFNKRGDRCSVYIVWPSFASQNLQNEDICDFADLLGTKTVHTLLLLLMINCVVIYEVDLLLNAFFKCALPKGTLYCAMLISKRSAYSKGVPGSSRVESTL